MPSQTATPRSSRRRAHQKEDLTAHILTELQESIPQCRRWIGADTLAVSGNQLEIAADTPFDAKYIDDNFGDALREVARSRLGDDAQIQMRILETSAKPAPPEHRAVPTHQPAAKKPSERRPAGGRSGLVLRRLEDLIVGPCNELAYAAACQLVDEPVAGVVSPLYVHGDSGLGKTHVLQGICSRFRQRGARADRVQYMTAEHFTNTFIAALNGDRKSKTLESFRRNIRRLDLIAVDDVHFFVNKPKIQSEFLHTLDELSLNGARVALASDDHPRLLKFNRALVSRFLQGMLVQVDRPDRGVRLALLHRMAEGMNLRLTDAALDYVASRCVGSVRELQGAVTRLSAICSLLNKDREVGRAMAEQALGDGAWQPPVPIRIATVVDVICEQLAVSRAELMSSSRHRKVVLGRALVAYLGRDMTTHSYPEIARELGRAYHSSVHTAEQRFKRQLEANTPVVVMEGKPLVEPRELLDQLRHAIRRANTRS